MIYGTDQKRGTWTNFLPFLLIFVSTYRLFFSSHDIPSITAYSQQIVRKNTPRHPEHHCLHLYHCGSDRRLLVPRCSWNSPSAIGPFLDRLDPASSGLLAGTDYTAVLGCFANWRKNDISVILLMALGRNTVQSHGAILNDVSTLKLVWQNYSIGSFHCCTSSRKLNDFARNKNPRWNLCKINVPKNPKN